MSLPILFLLFISFNLRKVELVDHNHSRRFKANMKSRLVLFFIYKMAKVKLVDAHLKSNYPLVTAKFSCINPFMEPTDEEVDIAKESLPSNVEKALSDFKQVFVISAWRLVIENGNDLYGIERTCKIFKDLSQSHPSAALIVCIGDPNENAELLNKIKNSIQEDPNIIFWEHCSNSWSIFSEKTIYLRPTSTDGNSISIHEALFFKSPVIASNVVSRPKGCTLFEYVNDEDYINKIKLKIIGIK